LATKKPPSPLLVIVTGLSGAGNSTALNALADAGMYAIDNLPMEMLEPTIALLETGRIVADRGLALCMDVRNKSFARQFPEMKKKLAGRIRLEVIFLTADEHTISTRFGTTRRKHPLMRDGETLQEAIREERELLGPVEEAADVVFDSTHWNPQQLARAVEQRLAADLPPRVLNVTITSFGFKYGQAQQVDTLFDVRFLDNPYFVPELKDKSGLDPEVRDYIFSHQPAKTMLSKMEDMLRFLLPLYYREGKHYFRLGVGCTGGRHRSVCFAEELGQVFLKNPIPHTMITILHRDIDQ
jgi:UPF0042 nucleotide-binding protein